MAQFLSDLDRTNQQLDSGREFHYFAGGDVRVFFENIPIPEITGFGYKMFQNYAPKYGYASYNADVVLFGNRIIQGQFTMNFRDTTYFGDLLKKLNTELAGRTMPTITEGEKKAGSGKVNSYSQAAKSDLSYDVLADAILTGAVDYKALLDNYKKKWLNRWRAAAVKGHSTGRSLPKFLGAGTLGNSEIYQRGFTIYLVYGASDLWYNMNSIEDLYPGATLRAISGVRIVGGPDQEVDVSGVPVQETYTFVATDLDVISSGEAF